MKLTTVNPLDFRFVFIPLFLLVTIFGAAVNNNANLAGAREYFIMVGVFVLSLVVGSWGIGPTCNRLLSSTPLNITAGSIFRSRTLFVLMQLYYAYILYKIVLIFLVTGFSAFETLRTDIKESISSYIYIPAQFVTIFCICQEIFYRNQRKFMARNNNTDLGVLKGKDYAIFMVLIYFAESIALGSRSVLFVAATTFSICWLRGTGKRVPIGRLAVSAFILMCLFGFIAFFRLFSNPETFNWWVEQGYFDSFDLNDIGIANAALTMLGFTIGDMVYRPVIVVQHIMKYGLDHMYGGVSFFFLYSILPGQQVDPGILLNHTVFHGGTDAAIPATIVSQLFWDFGWPGVMCGGLIIGLIGRGLIKMSLTNLSTFFTVLYAMFLVQLILGIYGTFNMGLLLFYTLMGLPLAVWINGRVH